MTRLHGGIWVATSHASALAAHQSAEALITRETAERLARRYASSTNAHRAGHLFEVLHAHSLNQAAVAAGSPLRTLVTEWMPGGSQTAPADLIVVEGRRVAASVQAKLYERASSTAHEVARAHYAGMGRLVASDRSERVGSLIQRRIELNPQGPLAPAYRDAAAHLGDRFEVAGVRSRAVTLDQAREAASDPVRWATRQVAASAARQAGTATLTGAAMAGLVELARLVAAAHGDDAPRPHLVLAASAAVVGAGARAGVTAGMGEGLRVAAAAGVLPRFLAVGTLPLAVAGSLVELGGHGVDLAAGRTDARQAATRGATTVSRSVLVWAFTAAGQAAIPVPVVGGLAGAVLGEATAHAVEAGVVRAVAAARRRAAGTAEDVRGDRPEALVIEARSAAGQGPVSAERPGLVAPSRAPATTAPGVDEDVEDDEGDLAAMLSDLESLLDDDAFVLVLDPRPR